MDERAARIIAAAIMVAAGMDPAAAKATAEIL